MTERTLLEPAAWYATLPSFLASASALITNPSGAVLLVKPNYRDHWNIPGGILEPAEPPHMCCRREIHEELDLELPVDQLLVVDWVPPNPQRKAWFGFVFDGGVIEKPGSIRLQTEELDGFAFVDVDEARRRLTTNTALRVQAALRARQAGATEYLFNGQPAAPGGG